MPKLKKDGTPSKQGEGGGAEPKFTKGSLLEEIPKYLKECEEKSKMPEKAGLRAFFDISKQTYSQYKKKYPDPIKRFENLTESAWVQRLAGNSPTGAIFYLKNAFFEDFRDRTETDITSGGDSIVLLPERANANSKNKRNRKTS